MKIYSFGKCCQIWYFKKFTFYYSSNFEPFCCFSQWYIIVFSILNHKRVKTYFIWMFCGVISKKQYPQNFIILMSGDFIISSFHQFINCRADEFIIQSNRWGWFFNSGPTKFWGYCFFDMIPQNIQIKYVLTLLWIKIQKQQYITVENSKTVQNSKNNKMRTFRNTIFDNVYRKNIFLLESCLNMSF